VGAAAGGNINNNKRLCRAARSFDIVVYVAARAPLCASNIIFAVLHDLSNMNYANK
jgi:hypothetical protein